MLNAFTPVKPALQDRPATSPNIVSSSSNPAILDTNIDKGLEVCKINRVPV